MKRYDVIVLGSGAGTKLVTPVTRLGRKVAIVEREDLGGTCLNRGCIPSKMLIYPADLALAIADATRFELGLRYELNVDFPALVNRVTEKVTRDSRSIAPAYQRNPNLDFYHTEGRFISDKVIRVGEEEITAETIIIATGSRPSIPEIPGLRDTPFMTSREALRNQRLPKRLLIIGGGYIACELGHVYGALGAEVYFLVRSGLLRHVDRDIQEEFVREFSKRHQIHYLTPRSVRHDGREFIIECEDRERQREIVSGDALLVAAGTVPCSDTLGIENTKIACDAQGYIKVDQYLQTTTVGVYALGDVVGRYQFRHSANFEGEYLFNNLFNAAHPAPIRYSPVPFAVFTHPQIAGVGKNEQELADSGVPYVVGVAPYHKSAMGMARLSESGFVKVLVHRETRKFLGAHIIGDEASDMIHLFILALTLEATLDDTLRMIYIHPALPEVARNACRAAREALSRGQTG